MQPVPINIWALLVAALAKMVVGMIWYSPAMFLKPWMKLVGRSLEDMKAGMAKGLTTDAIGALVMAFVLVHAVRYAGATSAAQGAAVGFFNWLGFVAVVTLTIAVYEKRPFKLFVINNGYQLVSMLIMGAILAVWRP